MTILLKYKHKIIKVVFILYILAVLYITQFPLPFGIKFHLGDINYNFIPFNFLIKRYEVIQEINRAGYDVNNYIMSNIEIVVKSFGYNVVLFLPFGFILHLLDKKNCSAIRVAVFSFIFSLSIELLQLLTMIIAIAPVRVFDVDDIMANLIGGVVGYCLLLIIKKFQKIMKLSR